MLKLVLSYQAAGAGAVVVSFFPMTDERKRAHHAALNIPSADIAMFRRGNGGYAYGPVASLHLIMAAALKDDAVMLERRCWNGGCRLDD
jgi:hypothetical protein